MYGSSPTLAGTETANPLALLMSATMMLNYLADLDDDETCRTIATQIKQAYDQTLRDGQRTRDLNGELKTTGFTEAVIARLRG